MGWNESHLWKGKALGGHTCVILVSTQSLEASTVRAEKGPRGHLHFTPEETDNQRKDKMIYFCDPSCYEIW